jgi:hypothetical protein
MRATRVVVLAMLTLPFTACVIHDTRQVHETRPVQHVPPPPVARPQPPPPPRAELLGRREVDFKSDRDVVEVGRHEGQFRKLRLVVRGAPLQLRDLQVIFGDNSVFDPAVRNRVLREDAAYVFDLPGHRRTIKRVTFLYRSINKREGKATVLVFGER